MATAAPHSFGTLLKHYRQVAGLTQEALAEQAGLSTRAISDLERGLKTRPHPDTVARLAAALRLPPPEQTALLAARQGVGPGSRAGRAGPRGTGTRGAALPLFVGHSRELMLLEQHLAGVGPPLLLLSGEPGIGKSRLLHEAAQRAGAHGLQVLAGGCQRHSAQVPYAPLLPALERHLLGLTARPLRAALAGCAWLVRLLPELAAGPIEPLPAWTLPPEQERRLLFAAVARLLGNVAGPGGTLLLLDDLQWATPDALALLTSLLHGGAPVRVLGAYRDTDARPGTALAGAVADLAQAGLAAQHGVGPLADTDAAHLLAALCANEGETGLGHAGWPERQARVLRRAGGVPFVLVSYAQALREGVAVAEEAGGEGGAVAGEAGGTPAVPWDVAQGVRQRVATLPALAQELLVIITVLRREAPRRLLPLVAGAAEEAVVAALETACHARLLEETAQGYRFAHDVIAEVVEGELSGGRRRLLHRRVAAALDAQSTNGKVEALAYHCEQGELWAQAVTYLAQAGDRAYAACAGQAAADYYARAYAASAHLGEAGVPSALDAARKCGFVQLDMGNAAEAMLAFTQMGDAANRLCDQRLYEMAVAYRGQAVREAHRFEEAEQALRAALGVIEEDYEDMALAANVWLVSTLITRNHRLGEAAIPMQSALALGWVYGELQDHERAIDLTTQGLQAAMTQQPQDPEREYKARLILADSLLALGRLDEAEAQLQIVQQATRQPPSHQHNVLRRYSQHLAHSYGELWLARGDCDRARSYAGACLALAESSKSTTNIVKARRLCGQVLLAQGKADEAAKEIEAALSLARYLGNPPQLWKTLAVFGDALHARGWGEEAEQAYRESLQIIDAVAAALDESSLRNTFLASAPVEYLRQRADQGEGTMRAPHAFARGVTSDAAVLGWS